MIEKFYKKCYYYGKGQNKSFTFEIFLGKYPIFIRQSNKIDKYDIAFCSMFLAPILH